MRGKCAGSRAASSAGTPRLCRCLRRYVRSTYVPAHGGHDPVDELSTGRGIGLRYVQSIRPHDVHEMIARERGQLTTEELLALRKGREWIEHGSRVRSNEAAPRS